MSPTEKSKEIKKKYGIAAEKYFVPRDVFKDLPMSVQTGYKEWRQAEYKKSKQTRTANVQQQVPTSDDSTIASNDSWVVMRRDVYQAQLGTIPEILEIPSNTTASPVVTQNIAPAQPHSRPAWLDPF